MIENNDTKPVERDGPAAGAYRTFIVLGIVFVAIAVASANAAFLPAGLAFLVVGAVQYGADRRRATPSND